MFEIRCNIKIYTLKPLKAKKKRNKTLRITISDCLKSGEGAFEISDICSLVLKSVFCGAENTMKTKGTDVVFRRNTSVNLMMHFMTAL